jgi:hypothetical protein
MLQLLQLCQKGIPLRPLEFDCLDGDRLLRMISAARLDNTALPTGQRPRGHPRSLYTRLGMMQRRRWHASLFAFMLVMTIAPPGSGQSKGEIEIQSAEKVFVGTGTPALRLQLQLSWPANSLYQQPWHGSRAWRIPISDPRALVAGP